MLPSVRGLRQRFHLRFRRQWLSFDVDVDRIVRETEEESKGSDGFARLAATKSLPEHVAALARSAPCRIPLDLKHVADALLRRVDFKHKHRILSKPAMDQIKLWHAFVQTLFERPNPVTSMAVDYHRVKCEEYIANEMSLSYGVICSVLDEFKRRCPDIAVSSLLDFGAGVGSGAWAFASTLETAPEKIVCVEPAAFMRKYGEEICAPLVAGGVKFSQTQLASIPEKFRVQMPVRAPIPMEWEPRMPTFGTRYSVVLAAFSLREIGAKQRSSMYDLLWRSTSDALILIETGDTEGCELILDARREILARNRFSGAWVAAPCPHDGECPMFLAAQRMEAGILDGGSKRKVARRKQRGLHHCHFPARISISHSPARSALRQQPRTGSKVRFQNEKMIPYSYVILRKSKSPRNAIDSNEPDSQSSLLESHSWSRLIRPTLKRGGHTIMDLCTADEKIFRLTATKSKTAQGFRFSRRNNWGGLWPYRIQAPKNKVDNTNVIVDSATDLDSVKKK